MLESIKNDRVTQLLIVAAMLVALIACAIFAAAGWRYAKQGSGSGVEGVPKGDGEALINPKPETPTPVVLQFKGTGDKVIFFDAPASGAGLIGFGHGGQSNFIVDLMKDDGTFIDQPANAIGEYKGEKTLNIDKGRYMLEISADGDWFVVILPPQ